MPVSETKLSFCSKRNARKRNKTEFLFEKNCPKAKLYHCFGKLDREMDRHLCIACKNVLTFLVASEDIMVAV
jgi:hypothetical protein